MPPLIKSCTTRSAKAGLIFPVGRAERHLRAVTDAPRVGVGAPVYLAGVLEYLVAELVEISGNVARDEPLVRGEPLSSELDSEEADVIELGVGATKRSVGARELTVSIACEPPTSTGVFRAGLGWCWIPTASGRSSPD